MRKFYFLGTCSTCKRILEDLNLGDDFELRDIKKTPINDHEIKHLRLLSGSYEALFSKRAVLYKDLGLKEKKLSELPSKFIVFSTTSQLTDTISEGMRKIKNQSKNLIPSNITTIQDFESKKEKDFMSYGSSTKNLYLLLLEDL